MYKANRIIIILWELIYTQHLLSGYQPGKVLSGNKEDTQIMPTSTQEEDMYLNQAVPLPVIQSDTPPSVQKNT